MASPLISSNKLFPSLSALAASTAPANSRSGGVGDPYAGLAGDTAPNPGRGNTSQDPTINPNAQGPILPHGNVAGLPSQTAVSHSPLYTGLNSVSAAKASTTQTQKMLVRLGFNIGVDGIMGPQTQSALDAHIKGLSGSAWTAAQTGNASTTPRHTGPSTVVPTGPTPVTKANPTSNRLSIPGQVSGSVAQPGFSDPTSLTSIIAQLNAGIPSTPPSIPGQIAQPKVPGVTPLPQLPGVGPAPAKAPAVAALAKLVGNAAVPASDAAAIAANAKGLTNNQVDPAALAKAAADAQYNPAIMGLIAQTVQAQAQAGTNQGDISGWYNTLLNNMSNRASAEATSGTNEVAQIGSTAPSTSNALGFDPNSAGANSINAGGAIQTNAALQANQANADFNAQLSAVTGAQGNASLVNQGNIDAQKISDLQNQTIQQQQARGEDLTALAAGYRDQNATNQNAYVSAKQNALAAEDSSNQQRFANVSANKATTNANRLAQASQKASNTQTRYANVTDRNNTIYDRGQQQYSDKVALNNAQDARNQTRYSEVNAASNTAYDRGQTKYGEQVQAFNTAVSQGQSKISNLIAGATAASTIRLQDAEAGKYADEGLAAVTNANTGEVNATTRRLDAQTSRIRANAYSAAQPILANAALTRAKASGLNAATANLKAKASWTTAYTKAQGLAKEVFAGVTGTNLGKVGGGLINAITGNTTLFQNNKLIATPQALANKVQQEMIGSGADMNTPQAKQYALTLMQLVGQNPTVAQAKKWFNYGK